MRRYHPNPFTEIPVSLDVNHQLYMASLKSGSEKQEWEILAEAVDEWTRRHNPDALTMPVTTGYQWKSLFLPDGTVLRTVFAGKNYHCVVKGDHIHYNEQAVSPSGFVNAVGGIRRNAWRCTWILFPDSKQWKLADSLRSRAAPRRARSPEAATAPRAAPSPAVRAPNAISPTVSSAPSSGSVPQPDAQQADMRRAPDNRSLLERRMAQTSTSGAECDMEAAANLGDRVTVPRAFLDGEVLILAERPALDPWWRFWGAASGDCNVAQAWRVAHSLTHPTVWLR